MRTFEVAARRLSFKDAADEFCVSATTVSNQIRQLEAGDDRIRLSGNVNSLLGTAARLGKEDETTDVLQRALAALETADAAESSQPLGIEMIHLRSFARWPTGSAGGR